MGYVTDILAEVDVFGREMVADAFDVVVPALAYTQAALGIMALMFIAYNQIFTGRVPTVDYLKWFVRFILVTVTLATWANFEHIYDALDGIQDHYSAQIITAVNQTREDNGDSAIDSTEEAMDEFIQTIMDEGFDTMKTKIRRIKHIGKAIRNFFLGLGVVIAGAFFAAVCVVITVVAKVGFIAALCLAPLALTCLLFPATAGYFKSWCAFTVGFIIIPILASTLMGIGIAAAENLNPDEDGFRGILAFVLLVVGLTFLTMMLPTMANSLASTSVAAVSGNQAMAAVRDGFGAGTTASLAKQAASTALMTGAAVTAAGRGAMAGGGAGGDAGGAIGGTIGRNVAGPAGFIAGPVLGAAGRIAGTIAGGAAGGSAYASSSVMGSMLQSSNARQSRLDSIAENRMGAAKSAKGASSSSSGGSGSSSSSGGNNLSPEQMNALNSNRKA
ncbi:MAG: type IV secretion system protein [Pseudomonadota bacterium]